MSKQSNQKLKLLYLNKYFLENTDENHTVTINELIDYLAGLGISAERKSLYDDFEQLRMFGTEVMSVKSKNSTGYYVADRLFEVSELKLLVDAVQVAKFITDKKSHALIHKLETLCSRHEAAELSRQVTISNRIKSMNESIYYNVDKIHTAIASDKAITFKYFEYNVKKERVLRHDGEKYNVSPFALNWDDENYYLVAFDHKDRIIKHYRVDKMLEISLCDSIRQGKEAFNEADISMYSKKVFNMFGGVSSKVCLEFDKSMCGVVIDRFGKDVFMRQSDNPDKIYVYCDVVVSSHFFGWLFSFGDKVRIETSSEIQLQFKEYCKNVLDNYN